MSVHGGSETVYLGLGSNLGDRLRFLWRAAQELQRQGVAIRRASSVYRTTFVGPGPAQPDYLNAVLEVATRLAPLELLDLTQAVERRMGRPPATHMQPRCLDVDVLVFGDHRCSTPRLTLPHPRLAERRFVLEPLHEMGVLDDLAVPGLPERLRTLRRTQTVERWAPWPTSWERHGIGV
jgi:2-amino-4-hydroxy-6-hydroxymethyldihydropteridine diphosphokinase